MSNAALSKSAVLALAAGLTCSSAIASSGASGSSFDSEAGAEIKMPSFKVDQTPRHANYHTGFSTSQAGSMQSTSLGAGTNTAVPETWQTTTVLPGGNEVVTPPQSSFLAANTTTSQASAAVKATPVRTTTVRTSTPATTTTRTTSTATTSSSTAQTTKKSELYDVARGTTKYATKTGWQRWYDTIGLKEGQDALPLILTITNGGAGRPGFQAIRLYLSGKPLATDKDFKTSTLSLNMAGTMVPGDSNQLVIEAYGPSGASLDWRLTTYKPVLTKAAPTTISTGQKLSLTGRHFLANPAQDVVNIGGKIAKVESASEKTLEVMVPDDCPAGDQSVNVTVGGIPSNALKIKIRAIPEVTGCDMVSAPPGQPLVISGKNFSPNASDNQVTISGVPAQISDCSATSITVTIPEMQWPQWYCPIKVKTFGVESKGTVTVNLNQRVIPNAGVPEQ